MSNEALLAIIDPALIKLGWSDRQASLKAGLKADAIRNIRRGSMPRSNTIAALVHTLKLNPDAVNKAVRASHGVHRMDLAPDQPEFIDVAPEGIVGIAEHDIAAEMGHGRENSEDMRAVTVHYFPAAQIRYEYGARPQDVRIIRVEGDSMEPTLQSGDRVMVDLTRKAPTPPGLFVVADGLALIAKRLEYNSRSDPPSVRIISDNPRYTERVIALDEVHVVGRVIWFARRV